MNQNGWPIARVFQKKGYAATWQVLEHPEGFYVIEWDAPYQSQGVEDITCIEGEQLPFFVLTSVIKFAEKRPLPKTWVKAIQRRKTVMLEKEATKALQVGDYVRFGHEVILTNDTLIYDGVVTAKKAQKIIFNNNFETSSRRINEFYPRIVPPIAKNVFHVNIMHNEIIDSVLLGISKFIPNNNFYSSFIDDEGCLCVQLKITNKYVSTAFLLPNGEDVSERKGAGLIYRFRWGTIEKVYQKIVGTCNSVFYFLVKFSPFLVKELPNEKVENQKKVSFGVLSMFQHVAQQFTEENITTAPTAMWF